MGEPHRFGQRGAVSHGAQPIVIRGMDMKTANAESSTSIDRRGLIALGLAATSAVACTGVRPVAAQGRRPVETKEVSKGVERKVYDDVESMIPGFAKVR